MATRLERLYERRSDPTVAVRRQLHESYRSILDSDSVKYTIGAMQPIEPDYTANTFAQGDRVRNQLEGRLTIACEFAYQGSVTNDTHIKARSDIDLLTIIKQFFSMEPPQRPEYPYQGDPVSDLLALRKEEIAALRAAFPEASVDATGSKCISIEGGSLRRKIDVVPSNWWNTNRYAQTGNDIYRGVHILDSEARSRISNTPFLHNARIQSKDTQTNGGLRKASRLMKSIKYDSDTIDLSSYDIVAIAYNIDTALLNVPRGMELTLLNACLWYCQALEADQALRGSLVVPDGHRNVFEDGGATLTGLNQMTAALSALATDVLSENRRSFTQLAEARVIY